MPGPTMWRIKFAKRRPRFFFCLNFTAPSETDEREVRYRNANQLFCSGKKGERYGEKGHEVKPTVFAVYVFLLTRGIYRASSSSPGSLLYVSRAFRACTIADRTHKDSRLVIGSPELGLCPRQWASFVLGTGGWEREKQGCQVWART